MDKNELEGRYFLINIPGKNGNIVGCEVVNGEQLEYLTGKRYIKGMFNRNARISEIIDHVTEITKDKADMLTELHIDKCGVTLESMINNECDKYTDYFIADKLPGKIADLQY